MPYITASLIIQLIVPVVPSLNYLKKEAGERGRRQINNLDPGLKSNHWKKIHFHNFIFVTAAVALEKQAFTVCEEDGQLGLTWDEVEHCLEKYQQFLNEVVIPSKDDFVYFDENSDGVLFFDEWLSVLNKET